MAWDDFILDATTEITVNITVPADLRPYLESWFTETKEATETLNEFVLKNLGKQALLYRKNKLRQEAMEDQKSVMDQYITQMQTDYLEEFNNL